VDCDTVRKVIKKLKGLPMFEPGLIPYVYVVTVEHTSPIAVFDSRKAAEQFIRASGESGDPTVFGIVELELHISLSRRTNSLLEQSQG
jgi:hypothetical protein